MLILGGGRMNDERDDSQSLVDIVERLRSPGGCPWDWEQTHASLKRNLLEECYEVLEAIDGGDPAKLSEELGDILAQVVFHAQIAGEAGQFRFDDVEGKVSQKLVRRHPHVFGDAVASDAREVELNWEALKQREAPRKSPVDGVPGELPALAAAQLMQDRVGKAGFEWEDISGVLDKVAEEVGRAEGGGQRRGEGPRDGRPALHHGQPGALAGDPRGGLPSPGQRTLPATVHGDGGPRLTAGPGLRRTPSGG